MSLKNGFDDEEIISDINMTPLIDIMLVLLIIFMVTSSISFQQGLGVDLPQVSQKGEMGEDAPRAIIVTLTKEGTLFMNGKKVALEDYQQQLTLLLKEMKTTHIVLEGDHQAQLGTVVNLMDQAKLAGAQQFSIATESN